MISAERLQGVHVETPQPRRETPSGFSSRAWQFGMWIEERGIRVSLLSIVLYQGSMNANLEPVGTCRIELQIQEARRWNWYLGIQNAYRDLE